MATAPPTWAPCCCFCSAAWAVAWRRILAWYWPRAWPRAWRPVSSSRFRRSSSCMPSNPMNRGAPVASLAWAWCWRPLSAPAWVGCWWTGSVGARFSSWWFRCAWHRCGWRTSSSPPQRPAVSRPTDKVMHLTGVAWCWAPSERCACSMAWFHCTADLGRRPVACCWVLPWRWPVLLHGNAG